MKIHNETLEEVNLLFEMIKTMLLTGLAESQIKRYLRKHTHLEIRNGRYIDWEFIIKDLVSIIWSGD